MANTDQKQEGMYMSLLDVTVRSIMGHTIRFKAGEPVFVPEQVRAEARTAGALPVEEAEAARERLMGTAKPARGRANSPEEGK